MYNDYYGYSDYGMSAAGDGVWTIIALVLAIVGGILAYFLFVKHEVNTENKFLLWFRRFLDFKEMLIEAILKVTYLVLAIFITLYSFNLISTSFVGFLLMIIFGNVVLRLVYEASLVMVMIWKNTTEINSKMKK